MGDVPVVPATPETIARAAGVLLGGGLVAFPTETVYGLGALASDEVAVRRIFDAKRRPSDHPLIVHLPHVGALDEWAAEVPDPARRLADECWPGPLTLVLRRAGRVPDAVTGGRATVGLRVPDQDVARALLDRVGGLAAPSANRFGQVSPTTAAHVVADLGDDVDLVLDGGRCRVGIESTIVEVLDDRPVLLRSGGLAVEHLDEILGGPIDRHPTGPVRAPGMLAAHYAPLARVVTAEANEAVVVAAERAAAGMQVALLVEQAPATVPTGVHLLSPVGDTEGYARWLYQRLRDADSRGLELVVAALPARAGLGAAVRDRLERAAASTA
jgi:L-threonylcarbamoyladenylate synthase